MTTTPAKSKAPALDVQDIWEWVELAYERNWTDGLPPLPPTPDKVAEMVEHAAGDRDQRLRRLRVVHRRHRA